MEAHWYKTHVINDKVDVVLSVFVNHFRWIGFSGVWAIGKTRSWLIYHLDSKLGKGLHATDQKWSDCRIYEIHRNRPVCWVVSRKYWRSVSVPIKSCDELAIPSEQRRYQAVRPMKGSRKTNIIPRRSKVVVPAGRRNSKGEKQEREHKAKITNKKSCLWEMVNYCHRHVHCLM